VSSKAEVATSIFVIRAGIQIQVTRTAWGNFTISLVIKYHFEIIAKEGDLFQTFARYAVQLLLFLLAPVTTVAAMLLLRIFFSVIHDQLLQRLTSTQVIEIETPRMNSIKLPNFKNHE